MGDKTSLYHVLLNIVISFSFFLLYLLYLEMAKMTATKKKVTTTESPEMTVTESTEIIPTVNATEEVAVKEKKDILPLATFIKLRKRLLKAGKAQEKKEKRRLEKKKAKQGGNIADRPWKHHKTPAKVNKNTPWRSSNKNSVELDKLQKMRDELQSVKDLTNSLKKEKADTMEERKAEKKVKDMRKLQNKRKNEKYSLIGRRKLKKLSKKE